MFYKEQIRNLQQTLLEEMSDARFVAALETALAVHGVKDCSALARLDVSSGLFWHLARKYDRVVTKDGNSNYIRHNDAYIREGTHADIVAVDGIFAYSLDGLKARYELHSQTRELSALASRYIASDIAAFQARQAKPKATPTAAVGAGPAWGELDADEAEFEAQCKRADWYYSYSDDIGVYRRGKAHCDQLKAAADSKGGNYTLIYKHYSSK